MVVLIPNGAPEPLTEFNACHTKQGPTGGQFCGKDGSGGTARPTPVVVRNIAQAVSLILKGKVVVLPDVGHVHTVLTKLAAIAKDAEKRGKDAPRYDLCKVSVAGTNLFCGSKLKTKEFPDGVPRIDMPQLKHTAHAFVESLRAQGIKVKNEKVHAASLRATQAELVGSKVAAMMTNPDFKPQRIFITSDHYILDGHHNWAAQVGRDAKDNHLGDLKIRVRRIDAPISEVLKIAQAWTKKHGIAGKAGTS
jgi:hypothetical protein